MTKCKVNILSVVTIELPPCGKGSFMEHFTYILSFFKALLFFLLSLLHPTTCSNVGDCVF